MEAAAAPPAAAEDLYCFMQARACSTPARIRRSVFAPVGRTGAPPCLCLGGVAGNGPGRGNHEFRVRVDDDRTFAEHRQVRDEAPAFRSRTFRTFGGLLALARAWSRQIAGRPVSVGPAIDFVSRVGQCFT